MRVNILTVFNKMIKLSTIYSAGLILPLVLLTSCDLTEKKFYEIQQLEYAEEKSDSVSVLEYRNGILERAMYADIVERYYNQKKMVSYGVTIEDYYEDETIKMTLVADTLFIDEILNTYTAKGNVVVTREEGILRTQHLIWNQNNNQIYSPIEATIVRGENILRGFELTTNTEFDKVEMKRVTAEGVIDEETFDW